MTQEERTGRVDALRRYHADLTPHYDDCGCSECNAHLLILELDWVKEDAYRNGYRDAQIADAAAEREIGTLRAAPSCPTCGADIEDASQFPKEEMLDASTGAIYCFVRCVNGHEVTAQLARLATGDEVVTQVVPRFHGVALVDEVLGEALELLREVEWAGVYRYAYRACLFCLRPERGNVLPDGGHAPSCRLWKFLAEAR